MIKSFITLSLILFLSIRISAQTVAFTYDENGNRLTRTLTASRLSSPSKQIPSVINSKSLPTSQENSKTNETGQTEMLEKNATLSEGEITLNVYPNPNKGILKVEFSNLPTKYESELRLYDLSGNEIAVKKNIENYTELDITKFKDGIYILRVTIDSKIYDWKVIKNLHNN